jgi:ADP-heptose:LPS heptosyltransferase
MQAPGDIIVLSAALRDMHISHPDLFAPEVWVSGGAEQVYWHNPSIAMIHGKKAKQAGAQTVNAGYSAAIKRSNQDKKHFIWGFIEDLNKKLSTQIRLSEFRPAIYMSDEEKSTRPFKDPYWVFLSGGKKDFKTKIWDQVYWQQVIDATKDRVNWVQCGGGSSNHIMHQPKNGIYANMIAKTSCREFLRLIYHAEGVVCVITMAMHAAAAFNKPCIVVAGGREPWWWEAYNHENRIVNMRLADPRWAPPQDDDFVPHKFLHSIGQLECCHSHGCWKKHVVGKRNACRFPVNQNGATIPRCKAEITPDMVVAAIDEYLDAGLARRAKTGHIALPFTSMSNPVEAEPTYTEPVPVTIPVTQAIPPLTYCAYGGVTPPQQVMTAGGRVMQFKNGITRAQALAIATKEEGNWIVWFERGATFTRTSWLAELAGRLNKPCVIGRAHRQVDGKLYPYPAFFVVHKSLLQESESFAGSFKTHDVSYDKIGSFVKVPTKIVSVAETRP